MVKTCSLFLINPIANEGLYIVGVDALDSLVTLSVPSKGSPEFSLTVYFFIGHTVFLDFLLILWSQRASTGYDLSVT